jgi:hypothetical protein
MNLPTRLAGLLALSLAACGSTDPARFYVLTPVPPPVATTPLPVRVRLVPVELPRYLAVPQIVTIADGNLVELAEYERWAEPLDSGFQRVLVENLARLVPTDEVVNSPFGNSPDGERVVRVTVDRFDVENGRAVLAATWTVQTYGAPPDGPHRSRTETPVEGEDYAAIAGAMSDALGELSAEIAASLRP